MDSNTFQLFVDRFRSYVDSIQQDTVDYGQLIQNIVSRLNITFQNVEPIDFENISPVESPVQAGGHSLNFFKGNLIVPEIDREHDVVTTSKSAQDTEINLPRPSFRLPRFRFPRLRPFLSPRPRTRPIRVPKPVPPPVGVPVSPPVGVPVPPPIPGKLIDETLENLKKYRGRLKDYLENMRQRYRWLPYKTEQLKNIYGSASRAARAFISAMETATSRGFFQRIIQFVSRLFRTVRNPGRLLVPLLVGGGVTVAAAEDVMEDMSLIRLKTLRIYYESQQRLEEVDRYITNFEIQEQEPDFTNIDMTLYDYDTSDWFKTFKTDWPTIRELYFQEKLVTNSDDKQRLFPIPLNDGSVTREDLYPGEQMFEIIPTGLYQDVLSAASRGDSSAQLKVNTIQTHIKTLSGSELHEDKSIFAGKFRTYIKPEQIYGKRNRPVGARSKSEPPQQVVVTEYYSQFFDDRPEPTDQDLFVPAPTLKQLQIQNDNLQQNLNMQQNIEPARERLQQVNDLLEQYILNKQSQKRTREQLLREIQELAR